MRGSASVRWWLVLAAMAAFAGCGGGDGNGDAGRDVPADVPGDPGTGDVPGDGLLPDAEPDATPDVPADVLPDPAFIHAVREHADRVTDDPYGADEPVQYRTVDALPDLDVRALLAVGDDVWAGTPSGVYRWTAAKDRFEKVSLPQDRRRGPAARPVVDLALSPDGQTVAVAFADVVQLVGLDGTPGFALGPTLAPFTSVAFLPGGTVVAGHGAGLLESTPDGHWGTVLGTAGWDVRDVAVVGDKVLVIKDGGVFFGDGGDVPLSEDLGAAVAFGGANDTGVRVACTKGVAGVNGSGESTIVAQPGKGGLPAADLTAVAQGGADVLVGHARGASAVTLVPGAGPLRFQHYVSKRWLPADAVQAVAVAGDGSYWIGTPAGATRVRFQTRRIADKEASSFDLWMARFWRMDGFIMSDTWTDDPWTPTTWGKSDFDNDGLWTQMGVGALCMAYDLTKDEKYYQAARKAMDAMFLEIDVPAVAFQAAGLQRGFITRSLVREDETALWTAKNTPPESSRWHEVTYQGTKYMWKDDTSSDETTGHFYGFPLFYDLCAKDDAERAAVAEHAGALARYIVEGGYTLKDIDGVATSFGHWEPERVSITVDGLEACGYEHDLAACMEAEYGGGWLNGVEILGHLLAAWHMTGDRYFYDAYDRLVTEYRYDEVARWSRKAITVSNPANANHSDHELAMLAYATLLRYEPDAGRRAKYLDGLLGLYEYEVAERQPLWAAIVALAAAGEADVAPAVQTLREMPADFRAWAVDNSHRKDALPNGNDRFDEPQWDTVFPYDEIRTMWWNGNPYRIVEDGNGNAWVSPTAFQLAYWAQRYAGLLVDPL